MERKRTFLLRFWKVQFKFEMIQIELLESEKNKKQTRGTQRGKTALALTKHTGGKKDNSEK